VARLPPPLRKHTPSHSTPVLQHGSLQRVDTPATQPARYVLRSIQQLLNQSATHHQQHCHHQSRSLLHHTSYTQSHSRPTPHTSHVTPHTSHPPLTHHPHPSHITPHTHLLQHKCDRVRCDPAGCWALCGPPASPQFYTSHITSHITHHTSHITPLTPTSSSTSVTESGVTVPAAGRCVGLRMMALCCIMPARRPGVAVMMRGPSRLKSLHACGMVLLPVCVMGVGGGRAGVSADEL
jgi:hypothetical protein